MESQLLNSVVLPCPSGPRCNRAMFCERSLRLRHIPRGSSRFCLFSLLKGSKASVQSQPADTSSLLQIPKDHFHYMRAHDYLVRESKPQVSQQVHSPSAERLLRRQVRDLRSWACRGFLLLHFQVNHALNSRRDSQRNLRGTVILLQK